MKVLITGATGFLGSHLTKMMLAQGYEVIILKRSFSDVWRIRDVLPKLKVYDIDKTSLEQPFNDHGTIDAVIHTAASYGKKGETYTELVKTNLTFPLHLLEIATSYKTPVFINTDTGLDNKWINGYTMTKKQFVEWGKKFASMEKLKFINIKLEHVYGPLDDAVKFPAFIIQNCLKDIPELNLTHGEQKRDFIYIEDVVTAYKLILNHTWKSIDCYDEYELGSGSPLPIRTFIELVHVLTGSKTILRFGVLPYKDNEMMELKADTTKLKKIGWTAQVQLAEGIKRVIEEER
jgi:CDP-paratose synthetase